MATRIGRHFDCAPGVLNEVQIGTLFDNERIKFSEKEDIGYSSFDLHLSDEYWKMMGSVKPLPKENIKEVLKYGEKKDASGPERLEKGTTYIFKLKEYINFNDKEFYGRATGRSSIGRIDVLTRLITEGHCLYDEIDTGYVGGLYLEVTPITFPVIVKEGTAMSQLRVSCCDFDINEMNGVEECTFLSENDYVLESDGTGVKIEKLSTLSVNLDSDPTLPGNTVGFRALPQENGSDRPPIDLTKDYRPGDDTNKYDPKKYWEPIEAQNKEGEKFIAIEQEKFYILRSKERFSLPPDVAVYCRAITEELGEIRIHYAGFVHPYFGAGNIDVNGKPRGTPLIFEVRSHNVDALLRHGDTLANIRYYRMSKEYKKDSPDYGKQELKLSKVFKDWPE